MVLVLSLLTGVLFIVAVCVCFDEHFTRGEKFWFLLVAIVCLLLTITVKCLQVYKAHMYYEYSISNNGPCLIFELKRCKDIPFEDDECKVIKVEGQCITPPEWFSEQLGESE